MDIFEEELEVPIETLLSDEETPLAASNMAEEDVEGEYKIPKPEIAYSSLNEGKMLIPGRPYIVNEPKPVSSAVEEAEEGYTIPMEMASAVINSSWNEGKMLIPGRPYNAGILQSATSIAMEEVKEEYITEAFGTINSSRSDGKMLIPGRPYNIGMPQFENTISMEKIKEEYKKETPNKSKSIQKTKDKIELAPQSYNEPIKSLLTERNHNSPAFLGIQSNLKYMRNSISNRVKTIMIEASLELFRLDDIENSMLSNFTPGTHPVSRVKTNIDDFFSEIAAQVRQSIQLSFDSSNITQNKSVNTFKVPAEIELNMKRTSSEQLANKTPNNPENTVKVPIKIEINTKTTNSEQLANKTQNKPANIATVPVKIEMNTKPSNSGQLANKTQNKPANTAKAPVKIETNTKPTNSELLTNNISKPKPAPIVSIPQVLPTEIDSSLFLILTKYRLTKNPSPLLMCIKPPNIIYSDNCALVNIATIDHVLTNEMGLLMKENEIIIAGVPDDNALFCRNKKNKTTSWLINLPVKKTFFGMSYIGKSPAIFGGKSPSNQTLPSVEKLNGSKWKSISPMIVPRFDCNAITHKDYTYVFGGVSPQGVCTRIERYKEIWELLDIEIPIKIKDFGLLSYNNDIILFGGKYKKQKEKTVFKYKVKENKFERMPELSQAFSTNTNSALTLVKKVVYLLDSDSNKIIQYAIN